MLWGTNWLEDKLLFFFTGRDASKENYSATLLTPGGLFSTKLCVPTTWSSGAEDCKKFNKRLTEFYIDRDNYVSLEVLPKKKFACFLRDQRDVDCLKNL